MTDLLRQNRRRAELERVFFIGAGFSAGLRYPVGCTLMSRLVSYLRGGTGLGRTKGAFTNSVHESPDASRRAREILAVIERVLATYFAVPLSRIDRVDVAEFFTLAHTLSERVWLTNTASRRGSRRDRGGIAHSETTLFADLATVTRSYFQDLSWAFEYPDDIDAALRLVRPNEDAIINFNWDEDVDIFHSEDNSDVSYTLGAWLAENSSQDPHRLILKPHGSIGWYDLQRGIGNEDAYLIAGNDEDIPRYEKRIVAYMDNDFPSDIDGTRHSPLACPPVITAPTFAKRFDYVEQQRIWRDVLDVCGDARQFVFLGYSLPRDDYLTRAALRAALRKGRSRRGMRCLIVDRSFEAAKLDNFRSVFSGLTKTRNYLQWEFGNDDADLASRISDKLRDATIA